MDNRPMKDVDGPTWIVSMTVTRYDGGYADIEYTDEFDMTFLTFDDADAFEGRVLRDGYDRLYTHKESKE